jgi:hypothetical protein
MTQLDNSSDLEQPAGGSSGCHTVRLGSCRPVAGSQASSTPRLAGAVGGDVTVAAAAGPGATAGAD